MFSYTLLGHGKITVLVGGTGYNKHNFCCA